MLVAPAALASVTHSTRNPQYRGIKCFIFGGDVCSDTRTDSRVSPQVAGLDGDAVTAMGTLLRTNMMTTHGARPITLRDR
jgi:hypothetical protein